MDEAPKFPVADGAWTWSLHYVPIWLCQLNPNFKRALARNFIISKCSSLRSDLLRLLSVWISDSRCNSINSIKLGVNIHLTSSYRHNCNNSGESRASAKRFLYPSIWASPAENKHQKCFYFLSLLCLYACSRSPINYSWNWSQARGLLRFPSCAPQSPAYFVDSST